MHTTRGRRDGARSRASVALLIGVFVVAATVPAACGGSSTFDDGTLPPLGGTLPAPTSTAPSTVAPAVAPTTTTEPGGLPPVDGSVTAGWRNWPYYDVPQLGSESVRGSGCGSTGGLGETLPDGVWNVTIGDGTGGDEFWTAGAMTVDVRCIYTGDGGAQLWNAACLADAQSPSCTQNSGDWYVVNANGRLRTVAVSPDVRYGVGALGTSPCPSASSDRSSKDAPWRTLDSWIVIEGGRVTSVITACPR